MSRGIKRAEKIIGKFEAMFEELGRAREEMSRERSDITATIVKLEDKRDVLRRAIDRTNHTMVKIHEITGDKDE